jgi:hypothetical protein
MWSPAISVMTVERASITPFPLFQRLPAELQDMVWGNALQSPRVITVVKWEYERDLFWTTKRQPPLMSVCRSSRRVAMQQCIRGLLRRDHLYYNPALDTVRLDVNLGFDVRDWSKRNLKSIGIYVPLSGSSSYNIRFTANDARLLRGLREIVILAGRPQSECEMHLDDVDENSFPMPKCYGLPIRGPFEYARRLRSGLEKESKRWKSYQRGRSKKGKSSPDWEPPIVRVAEMVPICETTNPCIYKRRQSGRKQVC